MFSLARGIGIAALVSVFGCSGADGETRAALSVGDPDAAASVDAANDATPDVGSTHDAGSDGPDGTSDASANACAVYGAPGQCIAASACAALPDRTAYAGHCAAATLECCIDTPNTADNPPVPVGYKLLSQSQVTPPMTTWAVSILHDPVTYPMYSTATKAFGTLSVLARVEWHPPDFQNSIVHRGVTLYEPM